MKKIVALLLACTLAFAALGCAKEPEPELQGKETAFPEDMYAMTAPIDALMRTMIENQMTYDAKDPAFFWTSLSYFIGGYAQDNPTAEVTEDGWLKVPAKLAQAYAIALFSDYTELLEIPQGLENRVTYAKDTDTYAIALGDIGASKTELSAMTQTEDSYQLTAQLRSTMEDGALIGEWQVDLVKNAFSDTIENPPYLYSVTNMTEVINNSNPPVDTSATFNGLADSHCVEVTLEDGTIAAFQFYDPMVTERLGEMETGEGFSFTYTEDKEIGSKTMIVIH